MQLQSQCICSSSPTYWDPHLWSRNSLILEFFVFFLSISYHNNLFFRRIQTVVMNMLTKMGQQRCLTIISLNGANMNHRQPSQWKKKNKTKKLFSNLNIEHAEYFSDEKETKLRWTTGTTTVHRRGFNVKIAVWQTDNRQPPEADFLQVPPLQP